MSGSSRAAEGLEAALRQLDHQSVARAFSVARGAAGRARGPAGSWSASEESPDLSEEEEEGESERGCRSWVGEGNLVVIPHRHGLPRGVLSPEEDSSERSVHGSEG